MIARLRAVVLVAAALAAAGCGDADLASLHSGASLVAGRPFAEAVTPRSTMRVDQFTIRAAVRSVPAPEGTGLPNVKHIVIDPSGVVPLAVHLDVEGVNNEAWQALGWDGQREYASAILAAIAEVVPPLPSDYRWRYARVVVKVWARTVEPITLEEIDEELKDDPYCSYIVRVGIAQWKCYSPSAELGMDAPRQD